MKIPRISKPSAAVSIPDVAAAPDPELVAQRDRLTERFALMQAEIGGLFYEMAIRDHVQHDVLVQRAAALQKVDIELAQVLHLLSEKDVQFGGNCPSCGAAHAKNAAFCSQCATPLVAA